MTCSKACAWTVGAAMFLALCVLLAWGWLPQPEIPYTLSQPTFEWGPHSDTGFYLAEPSTSWVFVQSGSEIFRLTPQYEVWWHGEIISRDPRIAEAFIAVIDSVKAHK